MAVVVRMVLHRRPGLLFYDDRGLLAQLACLCPAITQETRIQTTYRSGERGDRLDVEICLEEEPCPTTRSTAPAALS